MMDIKSIYEYDYQVPVIEYTLVKDGASCKSGDPGNFADDITRELPQAFISQLPLSQN